MEHNYFCVFPYVSVTTDNLNTFKLSLLPFIFINLHYIKKGKSETSLLLKLLFRFILFFDRPASFRETTCLICILWFIYITVQ